MKTSLTLSTVLFALTLSPAAFANGAQEQTPASAVATTAATSVTVFTVEQAPQVPSVTRTMLAKLELDVRANILNSLRAGVVQALQVATPALAEAAAKPLELSSR